jgi:hypothetical protein
VFRSSSTPKSKSKRERVKELPWAALLRALAVVARHWRSLSQKDRARLSGLVRRSGGRLDRLSAGERAELRKLAGKLDLKRIGLELAAVTRGGRTRRKRRRGSA